jgi:RNA ligase (TIGR02306 family)
MEPRGITYNPETLTADLGITKYEPPSIPEKCARLLPLRGCLYTYDIEGCDRFPAIVEKLKADKVYITEKLEGTNFGISITTEGDHLVNQRNYIVDPIPSEGLHFFHEIVQREHLFEILHEIKNKYWPTAWVTLRGEVVGEGVQGNHYGLKGRTVYFFDLEVNGQPIDSGDFFGVASEYMLKTAPVLARNVDLNEWLNGRTVQEASDGQSVLDPKKMREGIVIKPAKEGRDDEIGRLFLKQRGPKYLADTDN